MKFFKQISLVVLFAASVFAADKQGPLIATLKSDSPPGEKAIACKQLAIYGDKEAVPALAPLLLNKDLASWARIALEVIPGPEADAALRDALPKLEGNLLIGAINSIGVRRDTKAVDALERKLIDPNRDVVGAAAAAIGKIGGPAAARVLAQNLVNASKENLPLIAEGAILCAERFLADGNHVESTKLYDVVRKADVPGQRRLEATRGAILARRSEGLPLLLEQLRSAQPAEFGMGLRTARELKGREITDAIGAEMDKATGDRQVMLLLALSDRNDAAVLPKLLQAAQHSGKATRVAALGLLDRFGDPFAVPVLLTAAADADAEIARPAKATLTRMEGKPVDDALIERLGNATGRTRQAIIELVALRRIESALPTVAASLEDADPAVRRAAASTVSALGTEQHAADLVRVLAKAKPDGRDDIEKALTTVSGRAGAKALPHVKPLSKNEDAELRKIGLRALATIGGPEALGAISSAVEDADESVQDEAVGALATWPNNWPDDANVAEPLLKLAKSGRKPAYRIQGVRGYLLHLQENKKLNNTDKIAAIDRLVPQLQLPQEKRLAISTLSSIPAAGSLQSLEKFAADPAIAEEACLAIVNVASAKNLEGASKEIRQKALQSVVEKSKNDATRNKATEALKAI